MRVILGVAVQALSLFGIAISALGTYLMTRTYYPHTPEAYWKHLKCAPCYAMALPKGERRDFPGSSDAIDKPDEVTRILEELRHLARLAELNKEKRPVSLVGVDLLFVGFLVQAFALLLALSDVVVFGLILKTPG